MSNYREFIGKNVEKALEAASKELNLPKDKIKHDVISFGSSGIFGLVGVKTVHLTVAGGAVDDIREMIVLIYGDLPGIDRALVTTQLVGARRWGGVCDGVQGDERHAQTVEDDVAARGLRDNTAPILCAQDETLGIPVGLWRALCRPKGTSAHDQGLKRHTHHRLQLVPEESSGTLVERQDYPP